MGCSCTQNIKVENEVVNPFEYNTDINNDDKNNIINDNNQLFEKTQNPNDFENVLIAENIINTDSNIEKLKSNLLPKTEIIKTSINASQNMEQIPETTNYNTTNKYKQISTDKIPKEELDIFLKEYPPLSDNIILEIRPPTLLENEIIYYGEWDKEKNIRHGRGIQIWANGEKYKGYWKNDHSNGKGTLYHINGDTYEGNWEMDLPEGKGIYIKKNGEKYIGGWKGGKQEGQGEEVYPNGSKFSGDYKNGKKNGYGVFNFSDGNSYEGNFENNFMHGKGIYKFSNKTVYEGDWIRNKIEGKGIIIYPNGKKYEGEFKDNKKNGYGTLIDTNGKKYRGEWKNDLRHGQGEKYSPDDNIWKKGVWENGKRIK